MIPGYPQRPLTYSEWLASRGAGNPYAPAGGQQPQGNPIVNAGLDIAKNYGKKYLADQVLGTGGAELAADAGANAAFNAAAMEASGAPMTLVEPTAEALAPETGLLGNFSSMGIGPQAGIAAGLAFGAKGLKDLLMNKKTKGWEGWGGRITLGAATGGLSEVARAFGVGSHKSTKQVQDDHTNYLLSQHKDDPKYQAYIKAMRGNMTKPTGKAFHGGDYATWDEYKKAGLDAKDLTGAEGILDEFQNEWTNLDQSQREGITQKFIDNNLLFSKEGDIDLGDEKKARELFNEYLQNSGAKTTPQPVMIPKRSSTRSPGVGMDGRPVYNSNRR